MSRSTEVLLCLGIIGITGLRYYHGPNSCFYTEERVEMYLIVIVGTSWYIVYCNNPLMLLL
jgi:hypothetical protein